MISFTISDCLIAPVLCDRFGQAKIMVQTTLEYCTTFTSTVSTSVVKKWTREIETAESKRLKDPQVMDIMRAHQPESGAKPAQTLITLLRSAISGCSWHCRLKKNSMLW